MNVCQTIYTQLGGRRFVTMTGSTFMGDEANKTLYVTLKRNKLGAKWMVISLNGKDLYDIQFKKLKKTELVVLKEYQDIYFDQLQTIFTAETGMHTSL